MTIFSAACPLGPTVGGHRRKDDRQVSLRPKVLDNYTEFMNSELFSQALDAEVVGPRFARPKLNSGSK